MMAPWLDNFKDDHFVQDMNQERVLERVPRWKV